MYLFIAFLAVPIIEIAIFLQIGGLIGFWWTIGIVVATAILGTWLVRTQGILAMNNLRKSLSTLDNPSEPLAHGAMILVAGALLLTPGFFTDAVGFALLFPPFRSAAYRFITARIKVQSFAMSPDPQNGFQTGANNPPRGPRDSVVEGEFTKVDNEKPTTRRSSGWTEH
jgi:UPF0716 protein FxsA